MALLHAALHSPKAPPPLSFVVRHGAQESGFRVVGGISRTIGSLRPRVQTYRGRGATSRVRALRRGSIHWASPCEPTAAAPPARRRQSGKVESDARAAADLAAHLTGGGASFAAASQRVGIFVCSAAACDDGLGEACGGSILRLEAVISKLAFCLRLAPVRHPL